jgi:hypothetical protein
LLVFKAFPKQLRYSDYLTPIKLCFISPPRARKEGLGSQCVAEVPSVVAPGGVRCVGIRYKASQYNNSKLAIVDPKKLTKIYILIFSVHLTILIE